VPFAGLNQFLQYTIPAGQGIKIEEMGFAVTIRSAESSHGNVHTGYRGDSLSPRMLSFDIVVTIPDFIDINHRPEIIYMPVGADSHVKVMSDSG
jgi:hypothetical protein